jgi:hypothetical protein
MAQMASAEHLDMIEAFPVDRADQPFGARPPCRQRPFQNRPFSESATVANVRFACHKRPIRNGRLGEIKGQFGLKLWSSARYARRAGWRRNCHFYAAIGVPGSIAEVRRPRLCKGKHFNSETISSMIESLICGSSRRATDLERVCDRQHLQGEHV